MVVDVLGGEIFLVSIQLVSLASREAQNYGIEGIEIYTGFHSIGFPSE